MSKSKEVKLLLATAQAKISELSEFEQFLGTVDESKLDDAVYFEIEFRLNGVRDFCKQYKELFIQLSAVSPEKEQIMSIGDFLKTFITVSSRSNAILSKNPNKAATSNSNTRSSSPNISQNVNARLPKLQVPVFNGDYVNFTSYYEAFNALIHNNQILTDVERFMYLRDSLKGTASQLISNIQPTGDNYKIAFALLCERFNNPKLIINSHVKGIFELKAISKENAAEIRNLYDDLNKHLRALDNVAISFDSRAIFVSHILMTKFDPTTQREFSKFKPKGIPTMEEINDFLKERCQILEEIEANKSSSNNANNTNKSLKADYSRNNYSQNHNLGKPRQQFKQSFALTSNKVSCPNCKQNHSLNHCPAFLALSVNQRIDRTGELRTCRNCLYHSNQNVCNSRYSCQICQRKHHTLLHLDQVRNQGSSQSSANNAQANQTAPGTSLMEVAAANNQTTLSCFSVNSQQVILPTAVIQVKGRDKKWHKARVLLDSGSHINLITEEMANELQLNREKINTRILGINSCSVSSSSVVNVKISSLKNNYRTQLSCVTIREIAKSLPLNSFNKTNLSLPENIRLADENYNVSAKIDILIGASLFYNLMSVGQISLGENKPVLQKTVFGWIVSGVVSNRPKHQNIVCSNLLTIDDSNQSLEKTVERFWQLERVQPKFEISKLSAEQRFCERHFQETVTRDSLGRFIVSIPLNSKLTELGESKSQAMSRFIRLEKSLQKRPELHLEYKKFMREYIALGHMTLIENCEQSDKTINTFNSKVSLSNVPEYFLPHHAVIKTSSLTTSCGLCLMAAPKLLRVSQLMTVN